MFGMIKNALFGETEQSTYQVINAETKGDVSYEERKYEGGKFAVVEVTDKPFDEASGEAALKLLKYVGGENESGTGMGMTAPVRIMAHPNEDGSLQQKNTVLLRIPSHFQDQPPQPTDKAIRIEEREGLTVYSTQFGGFAKEVDYVAHAAKLQAALGDGIAYRRDVYFCNGYDPPMKPYGRRNEVWFVKEE
ncbi:heme-binding protein 1 [Latimeria chalumnae]|uniref:Heme-binding protein 1 n=1 Tax=Latimeria chalumnae TaxID=7897 RepID=H3AKL0_LATCH|nr:PREDICTED: heme-binding protein 1 [Latimeria chalumnae]|eukprot:XP_006002011.1 PREDICTED: heme-binding protein 1 [Latimeria chalumnae]